MTEHDALAFGRRVVPHGFDAMAIKVEPGAFVWLGWDHILRNGTWTPVRRAWAAGEPSEPPVDLALTAREEFTRIPNGEDVEVFAPRTCSSRSTGASPATTCGAPSSLG